MPNMPCRFFGAIKLRQRFSSRLDTPGERRASGGWNWKRRFGSLKEIELRIGERGFCVIAGRATPQEKQAAFRCDLLEAAGRLTRNPARPHCPRWRAWPMWTAARLTRNSVYELVRKSQPSQPIGLSAFGAHTQTHPMLAKHDNVSRPRDRNRRLEDRDRGHASAARSGHFALSGGRFGDLRARAAISRSGAPRAGF